jgi:hydroxyacylglutathione hydrolase
LEKQTNPFMRFDMEPLKSQLLAKGSNETPAQLFATLRTWKDHVDQGVENIN